MTPLPPLTDRQRQVLTVVREFYAEHEYPPTIREVTTLCGMRSVGSTHRHLEVLVRHGLLARRESRGGVYYPPKER